MSIKGRELRLLLLAVAASVAVPLWLPHKAEGRSNSTPPASTVAEAPPAIVDPVAEKIATEIERLKNAQLGTRQTQDALLALARRNDEVGIGALLALSQQCFHEDFVMTALGHVRSAQARPAIAQRLKEKISSSAVPQACVAIKSYGKLMGAAAVPELQALIRNNWARPDGLGEQLCRAAVEVLGELRTTEAQAVLIAEIERVDEPDWLPDYGSAVVAALAKKRTLAARQALNCYAEGLLQKMPGADDPNGRAYINEKIVEAHKAEASVAKLREQVEGGTHGIPGGL